MKKQFSFLLAIVIVMSHVILNVPVNISAEQVTTEDFTVVDGVLSAYSGPGGHVIIPDNITSISANTFLNRTDITSVSFPQGLKSIESKAFSGCTGLSSLDFPDSLIYIHYQAFFNCSGLTSVSFPESITIGEHAFHGCSKLSTLSFPIDAYIQMWAFESCSGLTSVYFSRGVYLEQGSFLYTNPVFYGYSGSSAESYAQKTGISFVPLYGHDHTLQMTSAKPATATENGNISYGYCIICKKYYSDKEGKTEITLADTVIPKTGTTAAKPSTSDDAPATVGTTFPDSKKNSFFKITSTNKKKPTATYVAPTNKNKKTVSIPSSVTYDGVTYKITAIADNAFKGNKKVTKVTVGNNVTTIGKNAFHGCSKLKTLSLGKNVTTIKANAFKGCKNLKTLTIKSTKLNSKKLAKTAFKGLTKKTTVKVPKKKLSAYKKLFRKKGLSSKVKIRK